MQHDGLAVGTQSQLADGVMEGFVLSAMALTTITVGTALYNHLPMNLWLSVVSALGLYATFLAFHGYVRRTPLAEPGKPQSSPSEKQRSGFNVLFGDKIDPESPANRAIGKRPHVGSNKPARENSTSLPPAQNNVPHGQTPYHAEPQLPSHDQLRARKSTGHTIAGVPSGLQLGSGTNTQRHIQETAPQRAAPIPGHGSPTPPNPELKNDLQGGPGNLAGPNETPSVAASPRDTDVEMIQGLIKKLADQVNAAEQDTDDQSNGDASHLQKAQTTSPDASEQKRTAPTLQQPEMTAQPALDRPDTTSQSMQTYEAGPTIAPRAPDSIDNTAQIPPASIPPLPGSASDQPNYATQPKVQNRLSKTERFAALSDALKQNRIDVLLEPIVGFSNHRTRHFEVHLQFRDANQNVLNVDKLEGDLSGTGLYPMIDSAILSKAERISFQLEERGRDGQLFTKVAGESLANTNFVSDAKSAASIRDEFVGRLVISVTQAHIRRFGRQEWETVRDLKKLGFRFAMTSVTDLDMDFEGLAAKGFTFARLDANDFFNGLPAGQTRIPAQDIGRHLATIGLTLIVAKIDDEVLANKVNDCGVVFGQGLHFGAPRKVKQKVFAPSANKTATT